ncbi:MAG: transglycosylase domain-containing protein, partial [bacterium]
MKGQGGALPGRRGRAGSGAVLGLLLGVLVVIGLAQLGARLVPLPARLLAPPSSVLRFADGGIAHASLALDERWRLPGDLAGVDPALVDALLALEDRRFWWHPGVDPIAVGRAAAQNVSAGRVVSGGSTLTLQLVRLLEPRPRTLRSKAVEAVRAAQLELVLSKSQILE